MGMEQESEWKAAQSILISQDLVSAAKRQLQFLAAVDRNRWLYEALALQRAIYRYNACWLPLLAKHSESRVTQGPLVVPLECEWVWHCHRLNPVRYKSDCEEFYGKILDNHNVASSVEEISRKETEEIWNKLYPNEPYDIDLTRSNEYSEKFNGAENHTKYDLLLAIERQISFFYQVSRPHVNNAQFLEAAVARYKGFLHLIKRNKERSIRCFCVPTYDIDLIWHTHQLHPASYCKDLVESLGKILEHDDTDKNRDKGQKLDVGFSKTMKQWENIYGSRYWRAGAMYRGSKPSPITTTPFIPKDMTKKVDLSNKFQILINLTERNVVEVVLELVEIKNLPEIHKKEVGGFISKAEPDGIFDVKRQLNIQSESGKKHVATFRCQPTGHLFFELVSDFPVAKSLGYCTMSMEELVCNLSVEKWLDLVPCSGVISSKSIRLRVAASCTVPTPAQHVLQMRVAKSVTHVLDKAGNDILSLQMREMQSRKAMDVKSRKELIGITKVGETVVLGEFGGSDWSFMDSLWSLKVQKNNERDPHLLLTGPHMVKLVPGRKLDYELKHPEKHTQERYFMTAVEFSEQHPYGKAVALLDVKSGVLTLQEAWFALPGIMSAFIVFNILKKKGNDDEVLKETEFIEEEIDFVAEVAKLNMVVPEKGGGYENKLASGGCGGGSACGYGVCNDCAGGCSDCGVGVGDGCESMMKSGGLDNISEGNHCSNEQPMQVAAHA